MDTLDDELEFQADMAYLNKLVSQIYWKKLQGVEPDVIESWNDIKSFGTEPIFAGMVFESMCRELM